MSDFFEKQVVEPTIDATDEAWESGDLGRSEAHVKISSTVNEDAINNFLGLSRQQSKVTPL
ncbi:hypothetical protein S726_005112 [Salmonella enterica subsp. enterica]|nr:hypothetical protein [Salmonella enterica subsp. enterica]